MSEPDFDAKTIARIAGGAIPPGWVKLVTCGTANEAEMSSAILGAEGIQSEVFGANTNAVDWFWQGFNDVDVIVPEADVARAQEILSRATSVAVEPAEEPANALLPKDDDGNLLVPVAAFENVVDLRDAQVILASAEIDAYTPRLVLRGDRPAGVGKRFVLRVAEKNLRSAKSLLAEEAQDDRDEPRCPKCGSWQVVSKKGILLSLANVIGAGGPGEFVCSSCQYRGEADEFLKSS